MKILVIILFNIIIMSLGHADESIKNQFNERWSLDRLNFVEIKLKNTVVKIPQSLMLKVLDKTFIAMEEELAAQCKCDTSPLKNEFLKKRPLVILQLKEKLELSKVFLSNLFWNEVEAFRRYGLVYVLINLSLEVIEHQISPIPLCKMVMFASRVLAATAENMIIHLMPLLIKKSYKNSFQALKLRWNYYWINKQVRKKLLEIHAVQTNYKDWFKIRDILESWNLWEINQKNTEGAISLSAIEKMILRDQLTEEFELSLEIYRSYAQFAYSEKKILSAHEYQKIRLELGKIGREVDKVKREMTFSFADESFLNMPEIFYGEFYNKILIGIGQLDNKLQLNCMNLMNSFLLKPQ